MSDSLGKLETVNAKDDESAAREFLVSLRASQRMTPNKVLIGEIRRPTIAINDLSIAANNIK